jgi:hypothetical protein
MTMSDTKMRRAAELIADAFTEINDVVADRDMLNEWGTETRQDIIELHARILWLRTDLDRFR